MTEGWDLIHSYSRAQAIRDGVLVDVTETAKETGFKIPVALTSAVYEDCVAWTEADNDRKNTLQDEKGRLWDVLWMSFLAARKSLDSQRVPVRLVRVRREGPGDQPRLVDLVMVVGPGDEGEPVITIMQPGED